MQDCVTTGSVEIIIKADRKHPYDCTTVTVGLLCTACCTIKEVLSSSGAKR